VGSALAILENAVIGEQAAVVAAVRKMRQGWDFAAAPQYRKGTLSALARCKARRWLARTARSGVPCLGIAAAVLLSWHKLGTDRGPNL